MENNQQKNLKKGTYLFIKLNEKLFAVPGNQVVEISEVPNMTKLPGAPDFLRGIIPYNKRHIPLLDLAIKLNMPKTDFTVNTCVLIINEKIHNVNIQAALLADAILDVDICDGAAYTIENDVEIGNLFFKVLDKEKEYKYLIINLESIFSNFDIENIQSAVLKNI